VQALQLAMGIIGADLYSRDLAAAGHRTPFFPLLHLFTDTQGTQTF
jgi:hypothetical protein